jgi:hypothetical protein
MLIHLLYCQEDRQIGVRLLAQAKEAFHDIYNKMFHSSGKANSTPNMETMFHIVLRLEFSNKRAHSRPLLVLSL